MITAWRLTRGIYQDQAMTGNGGLFAPGRWHSQGQRIIYSSGSLSLATLELFVNLQDKGQLARYVKSRILIPDALVLELNPEHTRAFVRDPESLGAHGYGDRWLHEGESCVLKVPSRIVVEEFNYLINPVHPSFSEIETSTEPYQADPRLLG